MIASYDPSTRTYSCLCPAALGYTTQPQNGRCLLSSSISSVQSQFVLSPLSTTFGSDGSFTSVTVLTDGLQNNFLGILTICYLYNLKHRPFFQTQADLQTCQILANYCVLQLYNLLSVPCLAYQKIAINRPIIGPQNIDQPENFPWLFYGLLSKQDSSYVYSVIPDIDMSVNSAPGISVFQFYLNAYGMDGSYLGMEPLQTQLQLCLSTRNMNSATVFSKVGRNYINQCQANMLTVLQSVNSTTIFYELFVADDTGSLYPVPVQVNGKLGRRFFLVDVVSGMSNGNLLAVRAATAITLTISKTNNASTSQIYSPVLTVTVSERSYSKLSLNDTSSYSVPTFSFGVYYSENYYDIYQLLEGIFSVCCILSFGFGVVMTRMYFARNQRILLNVDLVGWMSIFATIFGAGGATFFWFLFGVSMYCLIFFKGQSALYLFLPYLSADISIYDSIFLSTLGLYACYILKRIIAQARCDVFFIDWEKPHGKVKVPGSDDALKPTPVSAWRSIFMADVWNRLQTHRRVRIEVSVLLMYVIMQGFGVQYASTGQTNLLDLTPGDRNEILLVGINTIVWFIVNAIQIGFYNIVWVHVRPTPLYHFVDMLSLSNISLLVMDEPCHGYYIHGRSVHPTGADTNFKELNESLKMETQDVVPKRGLADSEAQVFEVFLSSGFRTTYDSVYKIVVYEEMGHLTEQGLRSGRFGGGFSKMREVSETSLRAYDAMNKFMCAFFDKNLKEHPYFICKKSFVERFVGATPDTSMGSIFYHEPLGYSATLLYGLDAPFMLFYALLYSALDVHVGTAYGFAPVLGVYTMDVLLCSIRRWISERTLKSGIVIDGKFLS
ncbi:Meckelin [Polychytrium aggregatum]|uniref:Meckelin n=1 Tax=Polychytrium aggregatum TaxID=110093 RepID=UPI0022FE162D|nr:Meckelin [Polychytrium aggregatum]KAI9204493.1 Meckelin [Polychytrium aggregatum]